MDIFAKFLWLKFSYMCFLYAFRMLQFYHTVAVRVSCTMLNPPHNHEPLFILKKEQNYNFFLQFSKIFELLSCILA